jgi:hypothetical protein
MSTHFYDTDLTDAVDANQLFEPRGQEALKRLPWVCQWKVLSALSTLVSITVAASNWKKELGELSTLKGKWNEIRWDYEQLWSDLNSERVLPKQNRIRYNEITKKELEVDNAEPGLQLDEKLRDQCQKEVLIARGLENVYT